MTGAAAIRLIGVTTRGIQYDDAFSILLSARPFSEIIQGTGADTMPPLYYFILHLWQKAGTSVAFLRLPGILFSLAIILLAYLLVKRLANPSAAVWTAAILAISPLQNYHAQDLRMYSLATLLILGWDLAAIEISEQNLSRNVPIWKWLLLILCGTGALYSHALAGFGLLAPYANFLWKRDWKKTGWLALAGAVSILLYLPWLVFVPGQIAKVQQAFWTPRPGVVEILQSIIMILGDIPAPPFILGGVLFCCLCVGILGVIECVRHKADNSRLTFFLWMTLIPPLCLFLLSYIMRPMFVPRGFLSAYIGAAAIMGILIERARPIEKYLMGGLILVAAVLTLPNQISFNRFPRSPFQPAARYIQSVARDGDLVLHDNKLSYFPFRVYEPGLTGHFLADAPGSENDTLAEETMAALHITADKNVMKAVEGSERVFFVVFQETISEYSAAGGHPVTQQLGHLAGEPVVHAFGDLLVLEYSMAGKRP
jgi:mannosyltransferase